MGTEDGREKKFLQLKRTRLWTWVKGFKLERLDSKKKQVKILGLIIFNEIILTLFYTSLLPLKPIYKHKTIVRTICYDRLRRYMYNFF